MVALWLYKWKFYLTQGRGIQWIGSDIFILQEVNNDHALQTYSTEAAVSFLRARNVAFAVPVVLLDVRPKDEFCLVIVSYNQGMLISERL